MHDGRARGFSFSGPAADAGVAPLAEECQLPLGPGRLGRGGGGGDCYSDSRGGRRENNDDEDEESLGELIL